MGSAGNKVLQWYIRRFGSEKYKFRDTGNHECKKYIFNKFRTVVFEVSSFMGNPEPKKKGTKLTKSLPELIEPCGIIDFFCSIPDNFMIIHHP